MEIFCDVIFGPHYRFCKIFGPSSKSCWRDKAARCVACRGARAVRGPRTTAPGCATRVPSTSRAGRPSHDRRFSLQHESNPEPLGSTPRQDSPTARLAIRAGRGDPRARAPTSGQQVCGRARSTSRARVGHRMERSRSSVCPLWCALRRRPGRLAAVRARGPRLIARSAARNMARSRPSRRPRGSGS